MARAISCGNVAPMLRASSDTAHQSCRCRPPSTASQGRSHVDISEGNLGFRSDAEPGGEDRIEQDDRHGIKAEEHQEHPELRR